MISFVRIKKIFNFKTIQLSTGLKLFFFQRMMKYVWGVDMGPTRCPVSEPSEENWAKVTALLNGMNFRGLAKQE